MKLTLRPIAHQCTHAMGAISGLSGGGILGGAEACAPSLVQSEKQLKLAYEGTSTKQQKVALAMLKEIDKEEFLEDLKPLDYIKLTLRPIA